MARRPKITPEQLEYAVRVTEMRRRLPSVKQLARMCGVSVSAIEKAVTSALLRKSSVSSQKPSAIIVEWPMNYPQEQ